MRHLSASLLLGFSLTLTGPVQLEAAATPSSASPQNEIDQKFEFHGTRSETPYLKVAQKQFELAKSQYNAGVAPEERLLSTQASLESLQRNAPYQFSLRSHGGTLHELSAKISASGEFDFAVVNAAEPSDLDTPLPSFDLRNVSWSTIVQVLDTFLAARRLQLRLVGFDSSEDTRASKSVICVLNRLDPPSASQAPSPSFASFQLTDYLIGQQTVDTIVDAIRTAWTMDPSRPANALEIKYHPATNLLFVSGPGPAISIARQVISGLRQKKPLVP